MWLTLDAEHGCQAYQSLISLGNIQDLRISIFIKNRDSSMSKNTHQNSRVRVLILIGVIFAALFARILLPDVSLLGVSVYSLIGFVVGIYLIVYIQQVIGLRDRAR